MTQASTHQKILLLSTGGSVGGTERIVINLARQLQANGFYVRTVFPKTANNAVFLSWVHDQGVPVETSSAICVSAQERSNRDLLILRRFIRASKPDVVNLHYGTSYIPLRDVLAVRLAGRYRCVVTVHHPSPIRGWQRQLMTYVAALVADAVTVVSQATRRSLLEIGVPEGKIHLIHNGMPLPTSMPSREDARARLGVSPQQFVVSCLGRLGPWKGIDELIEATARVSDADGSMKLLIAGDGSERTALQELAAARLGDRAHVLGYIHDTADLYAASDVFALPSRSEGFGLVYVEAALHGVPSVGTNVGGIPDAIADGETGLLVDLHDIDALAAALQRLRDDPALRLRLGAAARARAHAEFTDTRMAERYARIFRP